jgi:hypothetical protein
MLYGFKGHLYKLDTGLRQDKHPVFRDREYSLIIIYIKSFVQVIVKDRTGM